jgi:hypothetical protein
MGSLLSAVGLAVPVVIPVGYWMPTEMVDMSALLVLFS